MHLWRNHNQIGIYLNLSKQDSRQLTHIFNSNYIFVKQIPYIIMLN